VCFAIQSLSFVFSVAKFGHRSFVCPLSAFAKSDFEALFKVIKTENSLMFDYSRSQAVIVFCTLVYLIDIYKVNRVIIF